MDHIGLNLAAGEILQILTPGYRPPPNYFAGGLGVPGLPFTPAINTAIVDAMVRDYQVKLACSMKVVPIMKPKFAITGDPEVIEFVKSELRSIWTQCITDISRAMWYTRFGCEMVYKRGDDGMIRFERMMPYHPRDFRIISKNGQIAGLRIIASHDSDSSATNLSGEMDNVGNAYSNPSSSSSDNFGPKHDPLFNPKCFCYIHDRRFGSFEGVSELEGAFQPWTEKVREGGANSSRSLWFYKCAFDSGILFHPNGNWVDPNHPEQPPVPYRDIAQKAGESIRNGSIIGLSSETDMNGNRAWDYSRPEMNQGGDVLLQLIDHLDGKINKGVSIPDDVIEQKPGSTTGGLAGRTIPFLAFLESGTPTVRNITAELCRQVLVPEAQLNYGFARGKDWEITESGVNVGEFLGEEGGEEEAGDAAGQGVNGSGIPGDGDGDGVPNEATNHRNGNGSPVSHQAVGANRLKQFSQVVGEVEKYADEIGAERPAERKNLMMSAISQYYGSPSVKFVKGDGRRLGTKRASAAVGVELRQMSQFLESQHPREHSGPHGGQFAAGGHGGSSAVVSPQSKSPKASKNAIQKIPQSVPKTADFVGKIKANRGTMQPASRIGTGKDAKIVHADGTPSHVPASAVGRDWQNVHVSSDPKSDILATGTVTDKKGKTVKKTTYSDAFHMKAAARKFARNLESLNKDQEIFNQNQANRKKAELRDVADAIWLMDLQATRPGSDADTKGLEKLYGHKLSAENVSVDGGKVSISINGMRVPIRDAGAAAELKRRKEIGSDLEDSSYWLKSHGATTLEPRHIVETPGGVRLQFMGKESVWHDHLVRDPDLAKMLVERKNSAESPISPLFGSATYGSVTDYAKQLDGGLFTPKDFRTKRATLRAIEVINAVNVDAELSKLPYKKRVMHVAEKVSRLLGNRAAQALESYINPAVFSGWKDVE